MNDYKESITKIDSPIVRFESPDTCEICDKNWCFRGVIINSEFICESCYICYKKGEIRDSLPKLVFPYPPTANTMWRHRVVKRRNKFIPIVYLTKEAEDFKESVAKLAKEQNVKLIKGEVVVYIDIFRPRRDADLDNRIKPALDALKNIAFEDDKYVKEIHARRFDDKANPRLKFRVEKAIYLADQLF